MFHVFLLKFYVNLKNSLKTILKSICVNNEKQYKIKKILNKKNFMK